MSSQTEENQEQPKVSGEFLNSAFEDELRIRIKSSGVLVVETGDRVALQTSIANVCEEEGFSYYEWNADQGLYHRSKDKVTFVDQKLTRNPVEALRRIHEMTKAPPEDPGASRTVYVFRNFDRYFKMPPHAGVVIEAAINCINRFKGRNNSFLFYGPSYDIPGEMMEDVTRIKYERPGEKSLKAKFDYILDSVRQKRPDLPKPGDELVDKAVRAALGQSCNKAEETFAISLVKNSFTYDDEYCRMVKSQTMARIKEEGLVKAVEPSGGFAETFAGYPHIPRMFADDLAAFSPEARLAGVDKPDGALIGSPAGFGKSLIPKAIAYDNNLPLIQVDTSCIKDKYYGESERKLEKITRLAKEQFGMGGCVMWIDEADKLFGSLTAQGDDSTSGTGQSILGIILNWLQERSNDPMDNAYVICTFNNGNKLPDALIRPGRFGTRIWLDLPSYDDRHSIFKLHLGRRFRDVSKYDMDNVVGLSANFSGAEIEGVVSTMTKRAFAQNVKDENALLLSIIKEVSPAANDENSEYSRQTKWAKLRKFGAQGASYQISLQTEEVEEEGRAFVTGKSVDDAKKKKKEVNDD
jgi:hypothetical protein